MRNLIYIGVGRRFLALIIDAIVGIIWTGPFFKITHTAIGTNYSLRGAPFLFVTLEWIAYFTVMEALAGATVGKFALGIRVVREDGGKIDWPAALVRNVARDFFIGYIASAITVWSSPKKQRFGDMWAKTVVITAGSNAGMGPQIPQSPVGGMGPTDRPPPSGGAPMPPPPPAPPPG